MANQWVCYDLTYENGNISKRRGSACYSEFYRDTTNFKSVRLLFPVNNEWKRNTNEYELEPCNKETCKKYFKVLQRMGFKFSVNIEDLDLEGIKGDTWVITIDLENQPNLRVMILLNAIRYCFEANFPRIVDTFLKFIKQKGNVSNWNKFLIAHYFGQLDNNGHNMKPYYKNLFKLMNNKEFKEKIFNNQEKLNNTEKGIPKTTHAPTTEQIKSLEDAIENKPFKEVYKLYKTLLNE